MYFKKISFLFALFFVALGCFAQTTYYSKSAGNLNVLSTWGTNTNGTGTAPSNFTSAGVTYVVANTSLATISAAWTVSGAGSSVQVGNGSGATEFNIPSGFAFTGSLSVNNNGTLTILNATIPTINSLAIGSTVNYARAGGQNVTALNYYNLFISGSGQKSMTNVGNASISNSLVIAAGNMLRFTNSNTLTTTITGSVSGAGTIRGDVGTNLIINGNGNLGSLTFSTTLNLNQLTINRTVGNVVLGSNLTVGSNFTHNAGSVSLGAFLLTLNGPVTFPTSAVNGEFIGSTSASLAIGASTTAITNAIIFNQSTAANRSLSRFTLNRAAQTLTLASSVDVLDAFTHTNGNIQLASNALSVGGILSFPTATTNGYFIGSNTSSLSITGAGAITNTLKFDQSTGTSNSLNYFALDHTVGQLSLGNNLNCNGSFIHSNGTLSIGATQLSLMGPITFPAAATNGSITGSTSSSLVIAGTGAITNAMYLNQSSTAARTFNLFSLNRASSTLTLGNAVIANTFNQVNGSIDLSNTLLTLNAAITFPASISNGKFIGSTSASLAIAAGTFAITNPLFFDQTNVNNRSLNSFSFNRTGQNLVLGSDLEINSVFTHNNGNINLNGTSLTIAGIITFPAAVANGYFIGSSSSSLKVGGTGAITNTLKMDQTSSAGTSLNNFKLEHLGAVLTLGNNLICSGNFIHSTGTLSIGASSLTLSGIITLPTSTNNVLITGSATSSLCINGSGAITGSLVIDQSSAAARTFNNFVLNRPSETLVLANDLITNSTQHTAGNISISGRLLTINGAIVFPTSAASGAIVGSTTSSLTIGGTGAITNALQMAQTSANTKSLYDLVLSRTGQTLSIGNALEIRNSIRPAAGTIVTNSVITLKSDATRSAMLGVVGGAVSGPLKVETYAPGGFTGWTNVGPSGVTGLSLANWENQFFIACNGCPNNEFSAGGYFVSALSFSETLTGAAAYVPLTYTSALTRGQGYWLFLGTGSSTSSAITYSVQGPAVTGNVVMPLSRSANTGYNLLANPYASPIDWDLVAVDASNTNVNGSVYFYNPDIGQTISYASGVSSPAGYITNGIIPMGQGFYVQANVPTSITFREAHKSTANTNSNPLLRPTPMSGDSIGTVFRLSVLGSKLDYDETAFRFHPEASNNYDRLYDAYKQFQTPGYVGTGPVYDHYTSISSKANNEDLAINSLQNTNTADIVIPVLVKTMFSGNYTISPIDIDNFVPNTCVILKDKLTGINHDLRNGPYSFTIADTTSAPRFELRLCAGAVPVSVQALTANKSNVKMLQTKMNTVVVSTSFDKAMASTVTAYNSMGQLIIADKKLEGTEDSVELNFENYKGQVVMVKVSNEQGHLVKKFIIY